MVLKDIIKTTLSLDEEISIRAGGIRRKDEIFNDAIRNIPRKYENATIRNWKITRAFATANYDILAVEIDAKFAEKETL